MSYYLFITAIIIYILSLVTGLVLMMVGARISKRVINTMMIFHLLLFAAFLLVWLTGNNEQSLIDHHFLFLFSVCSGVALSGYALRMVANIFVRIYFSLYLLTLPVFVYSPSTLISAIAFYKKADLAGKPYATGMDHYYIEKHNSMLANMEGVIQYKIVKRKGGITKTVARHIQLDCPPEHIDEFKFSGDTLITFLIYCPPGSTHAKKISVEVKANEKTIFKSK